MADSSRTIAFIANSGLWFQYRLYLKNIPPYTFYRAKINNKKQANERTRRLKSKKLNKKFIYLFFFFFAILYHLMK
jgi:hypothetical protein